MKYKSMLADLPFQDIDQDALTTLELGELMGVAPNTALRHAKRMIEDGKWEAVHKRAGRRICIAYRPKAAVGKRRAAH